MGEDIPIGVWHVLSESTQTDEPFHVAKSSPIACVFFLRFQEKNPGDTNDNSEH